MVCVHLGVLNVTECFDNPYGNDQEVYISLWNSSSQSIGVDNGTIISIFCKKRDFWGNPSNTMVFNIGICKF